MVTALLLFAIALVRVGAMANTIAVAVFGVFRQLVVVVVARAAVDCAITVVVVIV